MRIKQNKEKQTGYDSKKPTEGAYNGSRFQTSIGDDHTTLYHCEHNYHTSLAEKIYTWYVSFKPGWRTIAIRGAAVLFSPLLFILFIPAALIDKTYRSFKMQQAEKIIQERDKGEDEKHADNTEEKTGVLTAQPIFDEEKKTSDKKL